MSIIPYDALRARGRDPGKRHPRSEGCLPVPVLAGSRGRVPFLRFLVILAGPVRGRVLVRLPDPFDAVDLLDILGDHGRDEGFPVASFQHSLADDGPGEPLAVQQGGREYLEAVFPEQAHYEIRIRVDAVKAGHERGHVAHPHTVDVGVRDRHDVIVVDPLRVEGPFDHLISLAGGERILPGVAVLGPSDPHVDLFGRFRVPLHRREVANEPGFLGTHERLFQDLTQRVHGDDLDLPLVTIFQEDVFQVGAGNDDLPDPQFRRGLDLRGHTADREDLAADAQRARHRDGLGDRNLFEGADDGRRDRDRRAVVVDPLARADELDMDVVVGDVLAGVLLDEGRDVLDRLFRDVPQANRGNDAPTLFRLSRRHFGGDGQDDATEFRHRVVADEDRQAVDHADDRAFRDERLILLAAFDHAVGDLLLERPRDPLRVQDMLRGDEGRRLFLGDVAGDADEPSEFAEPQGQLTPAACSALCLPQDFEHRGPVEVRNLPVLRDLLSNEPHELESILVRIGHRALHVNLVPVPPKPRAQCRVHALDRVQVARGDEDEVARHGFRLHHRAGGPFALTDDGELLLLHRGQQALLALHAEHVDLVDEQDALVGLMNRAGFDALVRRRLEPATLERVVFDVPEERARVAPGRIDERRHLVGRVAHEELRDHEVLLAMPGVPRGDVDDRRHEDAEQDDVRRVGSELRRLGSPLIREDDAQTDDEEDDRHDHGGLLFPSLHRLRLLRVDDFASLPGGHDADLWLLRIFLIVVDDDVLEVVARQHFRHRPGEHRLTRARIADEHHMPLLLAGLPDYLDGSLFTDDLVDEPLGDLDLRRGPEIDLVNPRIHRGEFFRVSHRLHHLLTGPSLGSRSNTRAFYLNTSRTLPRSSWRKSHTMRGEFPRLERSRPGETLPWSNSQEASSPYNLEATEMVMTAIAVATG